MKGPLRAVTALAFAVLVAGAVVYGIMDANRSPLERLPNVPSPPLVDSDPITGRIRSIKFELSSGDAYAIFEYFDTDEYALSASDRSYTNRALTQFLRELQLPSVGAKTVLVRGHADYRPVERVVDSDIVCGTAVPAAGWYEIEGPPPNAQSNECLAFMRAYEFGELVQQSDFKPSAPTLTLGFDPSPFMDGTNEMLERQLFAGTEIGRRRYELQSQLQLPVGTTHLDIANSAALRAQIAKQREASDLLLADYRSVVLIVRQLSVGR